MEQLSPTKARLAIQSTTDWSTALTFLSSLHSQISTPIPPFERNDATLRVLLSLSTQNEAANETHKLLASVGKEDLGRLKAQRESSGDGDARDILLGNIESNLDSKTRSALDELASTSTIFGLTARNNVGLTVDAMASSIHDLTKEEALLLQRVQRVTDLQAHLEKEVQSLQLQLDKLRSYNAESAMAMEMSQRQTVEWTRGTKVLAVKVGEYRDRIGAMEEKVGAWDRPRIETLVERETELERVRCLVAELEGRVGAYNGVPADGKLEGAREVYKTLMGDLEDLERRREQLFQDLLER